MEMTEYVKKEDVLMALRQERDCLLDDLEREHEAIQGEKTLFIRAGLTDAIEAVKKVRGEWK